MRYVVLISLVFVAACDRFRNELAVDPLAAYVQPDVRATDLAQGTQSTLPPAAADTTTPIFFRQSVGDRVLFEVDQYVLTSTGMAVLDGQVAWLKDNPGYTVTIEGHADEQGTREYNLALGARRARAVQEYLVTKGITPGRLRTLSLGKERPIEICSEEACYAKNRRAVTVLSGGGS